MQNYFPFEKENGGLIFRVNHLLVRTAAALQVSTNTVGRIGKEKERKEEKEETEVMRSENLLSTPKKYRRELMMTVLDTAYEDAIRNHIYDYYTRREHPTVKKLVDNLNQAKLFHGGKASL